MDPDELSDREIEALGARVAESLETGSYGDKFLLSRRQLIGALGTTGAVGLLTSLGVDEASAQQAVGQIGTESEPVDVEAAGVNAESVNTKASDTKESPQVNVRWFGADGDGSDDTQALKDAETFARSIKAPLYFPPGHYHYDTQLVVDWMGGGICGAGPETVLTYNGDEDRALVPAWIHQTWKDFTLTAGSGDHLHGIGTDEATYSHSGLQQTEFARVRVEGFNNAGGWCWFLDDVYIIDLIRCDAKDGDGGFRLKNQGGGDVTLFACNSRQHNGAALADSISHGVTVLGGNYANSNRGIVLGYNNDRSYAATIQGTYSEKSTETDIDLVNAVNFNIEPGRAASPTGIHARKARDGTLAVGGTDFENTNEAVHLGDADDSAQRIAILGDIRQDGDGAEITDTDSYAVTQYAGQYTYEVNTDMQMFTAAKSATPNAANIVGGKVMYFDTSVPAWRYSNDGGGSYQNI